MCNRFFVPLQSTSNGPLAAPAELPENLPDVPGVETDPAFPLDQLGNSWGGPQIGAVSKDFWATLKSSLNAAQVSGAQPWLPASPPSFLQTSPSFCLKLLGPTTDRLPMDSNFPCHVSLAPPLLQQLGGP
jgi:hypothetical protein